MSDRIAILVPCRNEEATVAEVVEGFHAAIPDCQVYVYDNNSTDQTSKIAAEAGAIVRCEIMPGKGNVVRRMFSDVNADIYIMVDGDATYDPKKAPEMVDLIKRDNLDMVVATRLEEEQGDAYRRGHRAGNKTLTGFVGWLFGHRFTDILSGYRAFSRRFVKSFPALASGFEIETELTIHALEMKMPVGEVEAPYQARPEGSTSKLNTWRDGMRIMATIIFLFKEVRPFKFFGAIFVILAAVSLLLAYPLLVTFFETGLVPRLPTAILTTGIMVLAFISMVCGIILDSVCRGRRETKRMYYLALPEP
ncbi:MAG: glycosyl transferase [Rhodospirillaceae bacterium]|nr:glycosyl transferase [Rhodospirillaceae bacterium]|tara:strand:- start:862 stop:1782 length:921 start_codon:yes stop_codon:yes gene_type:complete